jgi:tetratricopeptide (TPR) repeat protein
VGARAKELGDFALEIRASRTISWALAHTGRSNVALERLEPILALIEAHLHAPELRDPRVANAALASYLDWAEFASFAEGAPIAARLAMLDRAEVFLKAIGRTEWRCSLVSTRATLFRRMGKLEEAATLCQESILTYDANASAYTLASYRQQYADVLCELGRIESAETQFMAILMEPGRTARDAKSAYIGLARCALRRGATVEGLEHANQAVRAASELGDDAACNALGILIDALIASSELEHATAVADQLVDRARRTGNPTRLFYALRSHADVALKTKDTDAARATLEEMRRLAQDLDVRSGGGERYMAQVRRRLSSLP